MSATRIFLILALLSLILHPIFVPLMDSTQAQQSGPQSKVQEGKPSPGARSQRNIMGHNPVTVAGQQTVQQGFYGGVPQSYINDAIPPPRRDTRESDETETIEATSDCLIPYLLTDETPTKIVCINLNIFQKSDGSGNWQDTETDIANLLQLVQWANGFYHNCPPSDPCPGVGPPVDTKIRFVLRNIYFYQNTDLWSSANATSLLNAVFSGHPDARQQLNIMFTEGDYPGASAYAFLPDPKNLDFDQLIVMFKSYNGGVLGFATASTLAHELGHTLNLHHPYSAGGFQESCNTSSCEYLGDLFCPPTNPCPQQGGWDCNPTLPSSTCTNNMMGGIRDACHFTALQIAKMHRALTLSSAQKYLFPCAAGCGGCVMPPANLMLWLPFDGKRPGPVIGHTADYSPYGNNGRAYNVPTFSIGKVQTALCFDGSDDYVEVANKPPIKIGTGNFSIGFWIKVEAANAIQVSAIIDKRQASPLKGYHIAYIVNKLWLQLADGVGSSWNNYPSNIFIGDGKWHFVAVTVQRNADSGIKWYKDGILVPPQSPSENNPKGRSGSLDNNAPLWIGRNAISSGHLKGCLDEVEIFNRVLSSAEILSIFQAGSFGKCKLTATRGRG